MEWVGARVLREGAEHAQSMDGRAGTPPRRQNVVATPPRTRSTGTPPKKRPGETSLAARPALITRLSPRSDGTVAARDDLRASRIAQHGQVAVSFYQFDEDSSGFLDESEIGAFCKTLGLLLTDAEVAKALDEMEIDGTRDGKIDFDEFVAWWASDSTTKQRGSLAFRLQQAKEEAFQAELDSGSPLGRMLSQKRPPSAKSQAEEASAPAAAGQMPPAAAAGNVDPAAKGGEDQERPASPITVQPGAGAIQEEQRRTWREEEETAVRNVQDTEFLETSRLFDDTVTTFCSRSVVVFLLAALVICALIIIGSTWDSSMELAEAEAAIIVSIFVCALINFLLVVCWWFDCSWMKGKRFVCLRNADYPKPVKSDQP